MAATASQHEDWYQSDDVLSADRDAGRDPGRAPIRTPANPLLAGGPTLMPGTDPSLGLRGIVASVLDNAEPAVGSFDVGMHSVSELDVVTVQGSEPAEVEAPSATDRLLGLVSGVPIERVAPVMAVAFGASVVLWALVRLLF